MIIVVTPNRADEVNSLPERILRAIESVSLDGSLGLARTRENTLPPVIQMLTKTWDDLFFHDFTGSNREMLQARLTAGAKVTALIFTTSDVDVIEGAYARLKTAGLDERTLCECKKIMFAEGMPLSHLPTTLPAYVKARGIGAMLSMDLIFTFTSAATSAYLQTLQEHGFRTIVKQLNPMNLGRLVSRPMDIEVFDPTTAKIGWVRTPWNQQDYGILQSFILGCKEANKDVYTTLAGDSSIMEVSTLLHDIVDKAEDMEGNTPVLKACSEETDQVKPTVLGYFSPSEYDDWLSELDFLVSVDSPFSLHLPAIDAEVSGIPSVVIVEQHSFDTRTTVPAAFDYKMDNLTLPIEGQPLYLLRQPYTSGNEIRSQFAISVVSQAHKKSVTVDPINGVSPYKTWSGLNTESYSEPLERKLAMRNSFLTEVFIAINNLGMENK